MSLPPNHKIRKPQSHDKFLPAKRTLFDLLEQSVDDNRKARADNIGISLSTLNSGLRHRPPKFSFFNLPALLKTTGDHRILFFLAEFCGYQLYRLPDPLRQADVAQTVGDLLVTGAGLQRAASAFLVRPGDQEIREELAVHLEWIRAISVTLTAALEKAGCKNG